MSNVLVIHPDDRSTDMLKAVYEGYDFDVINDVHTTDAEVREAIMSHDTIIMLGHGTPDGLLCGNGVYRFHHYIIDESHVPLFEGKKTYSMWCNSDEFFKKFNIGGFHSGMIISEQSEAYMFGYDGTDESIAESLMPLMHAMHDSLNMENLDEMKSFILERYNANDGVTQFNRKNIVIL